MIPGIEEPPSVNNMKNRRSKISPFNGQLKMFGKNHQPIPCLPTSFGKRCSEMTSFRLDLLAKLLPKAPRVLFLSLSFVLKCAFLYLYFWTPIAGTCQCAISPGNVSGLQFWRCKVWTILRMRNNTYDYIRIFCKSFRGSVI